MYKDKTGPIPQETSSDSKYIFWPDLAISNQANATLTAVDTLGMKYILREENVVSVPQFCPVEKLQAHLETKNL